MNRLGSSEHRRDDVGCEEREGQQTSDVAAGDSLGLRDFNERLGPASHKILEPFVSASDRLDQGSVQPGCLRFRFGATEYKARLDSAAPNRSRNRVADPRRVAFEQIAEIYPDHDLPCGEVHAINQFHGFSTPTM